LQSVYNLINIQIKKAALKLEAAFLFIIKFILFLPNLPLAFQVLLFPVQQACFLPSFPLLPAQPLQPLSLLSF
jgi:hypothetical protein